MYKLRSRLGGGFLANGPEETEINMAPLIDMVFILLIFFLVTTSFVREAGLEVDRPRAATAETQQKVGLMVGVSREGRIYIDRREVDLRSVRGQVERFLAEVPEGGVVIVADRESRSGRVIEVLDQCRLAGARDVSVAAEKEGP